MPIEKVKIKTAWVADDLTLYPEIIYAHRGDSQKRFKRKTFGIHTTGIAASSSKLLGKHIFRTQLFQQPRSKGKPLALSQ